MTSPQGISVTVLVSGSGTLLQSILDNQDSHYYVNHVVADVECAALERADKAGVPTRVISMMEDRAAWNVTLADAVEATDPDLVVSAGFMKILGQDFLNRFDGRIINTHPALLPSFPGAHAVRDALAYGVKVTGSTVHYVDAGVDTGEIIAQRAVEIRAGEDEAALHERIKVVERELIVDTLRSATIDPTTRKVKF
ncbi:phosphoribosylglycinamide formyltransferase [Corynebacterium breve]|uniref:Phosphoribosylglycinamide formyltransferase n=1 Tax=Corynebacterium breve TaxID=3049799 RepID=A0ABY8VJK0_9CORY|nr:phosphoribosylglycinamide formyltransferase [Corynebacterium breve]WIM68403.1 phosphoribosylglycinamide formyltransferase [Corynebacterium breve]